MHQLWTRLHIKFLKEENCLRIAVSLGSSQQFVRSNT
jgi:hypothetical protein